MNWYLIVSEITKCPKNVSWKCVISSVFVFMSNYENVNVIAVVKERADGHTVFAMMKSATLK